MLIEDCNFGFASCEKRQCLGRCTRWWCQKGPGRGVLFRLAKTGQDPVDDVLVLNTSDDSDRSAAEAADFNVDIEYSLESLGPGHGGMALDR